MQNKVQDGKKLTFIAGSGGVLGGKGVKIGQIFGVIEADAAEGELYTVDTEGVFDLPKNDGDTPAVGALLYWDDSAKDVTTTATSNLLIGCHVGTAAAGSGDATVRTRLNGIARADEAGA